MEEIGADPLLRGFHTLFRKEYHRIDIRETVRGQQKCVVYDTPVGQLTEGHTYVEKANTWYLTEHPVKGSEDIKILTFIYENMEITPNIASFVQDATDLGDRGLYIPVIGADMKTSFQGLVEHWIGTEELTYMLFDEPAAVENCLFAMRRRALETVEISLEAPAEAYIFWEDSSTTNISPDFFHKYTAPEISRWAEKIHVAGKLLVHHACGHLKALLPEIALTGVDVIESISPPPTGNVELWDAAKELPEQIALIGGIEPTMLLGLDLFHLESYVADLIEKMKGKRFVLANSDSCPPGVDVEKFRLISRLTHDS